MIDPNYLQEGFINQAKPAIDRWNSAGGSTVMVEEWLPFAADGTSYMGEEVHIPGTNSRAIYFNCVLSDVNKYKVTIDGAEYYAAVVDGVLVMDGFDTFAITVDESTSEAVIRQMSTNAGMTCTMKIERCVMTEAPSVILPELTNPAEASHILEGYEAIDEDGKAVTGTHVCESGKVTYEWVNTFSDGTTLAGGSFNISENARSKTYSGMVVIGEQYRMTVDGVEYLLVESDGVWANEDSPFTAEISDSAVVIAKNGFSSSYSGTLKLESKVAVENTGVTLPELTNPATAEQILEGYEAIDEDGKAVTGTHVCAGVDLPELSNPASAIDIASGFEAIDSDGNIITGTVSVYDSGETYEKPSAGTWANRYSGTIFSHSSTLTAPLMLRSGSIIRASFASNIFGDAEKSDVLSGKTFTSTAGRKTSGTHVCPTVAELTADANATAEDIAEGKTAYVNGELLTGTHVCESGGNYESVKIDLSIFNEGVTIPAQQTYGYSLGFYYRTDSPTGYTECAGFIPGTPIGGYIVYQDKGRCWALVARNCTESDYVLEPAVYDFVITQVITP